ncbi:MAG: YtxH domain-containing protein [Turicibacter sp.]
MKKRNVFLLGALLGAGAVALLTPKSGKDMQNDIMKTVDDVQAKIKDLDVDEVKEQFLNKLDEVKSLVSEFDWEASKAELDYKVNDVKQKLNEMLERVEEAKASIEDQALTLEEDLEEDFTIVIDTVKDSAKEAINTVKAATEDVVKTGSEIVDAMAPTEETK